MRGGLEVGTRTPPKSKRVWVAQMNLEKNGYSYKPTKLRPQTSILLSRLRLRSHPSGFDLNGGGHDDIDLIFNCD